MEIFQGWRARMQHCKVPDVIGAAPRSAMALILHIGHQGSHQYLARVFDGKLLVGTPTVHPRIEDAILAYGANAPEVFPQAEAFSIWYGGWTIGCIARTQMDTDATQLANRLLVLSAVVR